MGIRFYEINEIGPKKLEFSVICAAYKGNWVLVRHKERSTWEIPGGHIETGESALDAAKRELYEETGALDFNIDPICDYSVDKDGCLSYGRLYYADIQVLGELEASEIAEVREFKKHPDTLTYPLIMPFLIQKTMKYLKNKALCILKRNKSRNINIINFIKTYPVYFIGIKGNSVLVRGQSDEKWVYISSTEEEFHKILPLIDKDDKCFAVLDDWMLDRIINGREQEISLSSLKLVYEGLPIKRELDESIQKLGLEYAQYIYDNSKYQDVITVEYIVDRIKNGVAYGLFDGGILAAWAITHDDGAIGFLNVVDKYRRRGYAYAVTVSIINTLLEKGEIPFVHIEESNEPSQRLVKKIGFEEERRVSWIKLKA